MAHAGAAGQNVNKAPTPREKVRSIWRDYWRAHSGQIGKGAPEYLQRSLEAACGDLKGRRVLEAGSGTGGLAVGLSAKAARVCVLDIIPDCVRGADPVLWRLAGDLFKMPFVSDSFDVVFNSGVMEHFGNDDLRRGLEEMYRVLKPGGRLVVIVPSAHGRFYVAGKKRQEARGEWEYGVENPIETLKHHVAHLPLKGVSERLTGVRWQTRFLDGWRRVLANFVVAPFSEQSRMGSALFGGYLLVSTWQKQ